MATRLWAAAALNPPLLTLSSASPLPSSSRFQAVSSTPRLVPRGRLHSRRLRPAKFVCRRAKTAYDDYKFPDPIPEFAAQVIRSPPSLATMLPLELPPCRCGCLISSQISVSQETSKFREHMMWRLEQKKEDYFGEHVEEIVDVCTEASSCLPCASFGVIWAFLFVSIASSGISILGTFLEHDYCGPGTLLVHPFLDMKGEIKERGLPGAPQAARAAIAWAEKNVDKDWKVWTGEY
ncbi:hypothetical protein ABZP36_035632 [Zizania latifolia]